MALASLPRSFSRIRSTAKEHCDPISLGRLLRSSTPELRNRLWLAQWLQEQLPIRLSRRIEDLIRLPHVVVSIPQINAVLGAYVETFESVSSHKPVRGEEHEESFLRLIQDQLQKHHSGTRLVAEGFREVRRQYPSIRLDEFLDTHFTTRIATRILMDNYVEMRSPKDGFMGAVCRGMRPMDVVGELASELVELTTELYGLAPEVVYRGSPDIILDYIPRHVKYMVRELLKNAFRATAEKHLSREQQGSRGSDIPPIVVELQQADNHVIIKISDQGGGMSKRVQRDAWQYGWTTVRSSGSGNEVSMFAEESCSWDRTHEDNDAAPKIRSELAGFGFGLPLTRMHAQYFGGDVFLQSFPGYGTDLYLVLAHLDCDSPNSQDDDLATNLHAKENLHNSVQMAP